MFKVFKILRLKLTVFKVFEKQKIKTIHIKQYRVGVNELLPMQLGRRFKICMIVPHQRATEETDAMGSVITLMTLSSLSGAQEQFGGAGVDTDMMGNSMRM